MRRGTLPDEGLGAVAGLRQQELHVLDATLAKAALAVAQVQLPQPPEALVVAELGEPLPALGETLAPARPARGVVGGDVLKVNLAQVRGRVPASAR